MARPQRVRPRDQVVGIQTDSPDSTQRAVDELARLSAIVTARTIIEMDLVVGDNRVNHNLGRLPRHVSLMPTVADAAFAWAVTEKDDRQLVVTIIGVAQPGASIEVS